MFLNNLARRARCESVAAAGQVSACNRLGDGSGFTGHVEALNIDIVAIRGSTNACERGRARHTEHTEDIPNPVNNRDGGR